MSETDTDRDIRNAPQLIDNLRGCETPTAAVAANVIERLLAERDAQVREAWELLAGVEWSYIGGPAGQLHCLRCGRTKSEGHNPVCRLAAFLARAAEPKA